MNRYTAIASARELAAAFDTDLIGCFHLAGMVDAVIADYRERHAELVA